MTETLLCFTRFVLNHLHWPTFFSPYPWTPGLPWVWAWNALCFLWPPHIQQTLYSEQLLHLCALVQPWLRVFLQAGRLPVVLRCVWPVHGTLLLCLVSCVWCPPLDLSGYCYLTDILYTEALWIHSWLRLHLGNVFCVSLAYLARDPHGDRAL